MSTTYQVTIGKEKSQVLAQTMQLLSYTLIFGSLMSYLAMYLGAGHGIAMISSIIAIAVIWFVLPKTQNTSMGIITAFSISGLLGFSIGPMISHYLAMDGGASIVVNALMGTGVSFFAISHYAKISGKDFSFMNGFIFLAMISVIILSLINMFIIESSMLSLGISFVVVLLMGAYLLSQITSIINGGETNYISATVGIYLALHNMFASLMHIFGAFSED